MSPVRFWLWPPFFGEMSYLKITVPTHGERLYSITEHIHSSLSELTLQQSGILHLFIQHTSCALTISEDYDPSAKRDLEVFLKYLAPRNLPFIEHTLEGEDDSPSHMKSILLQQHLALPVEDGKLLLGTWQGVYLAEFRDAPHQRSIILKFQRDN